MTPRDTGHEVLLKSQITQMYPWSKEKEAKNKHLRVDYLPKYQRCWSVLGP